MDQSADVEIDGREITIKIPSQWHSEFGAMIMDRDVREISFDVREMTALDRVKMINALSEIGIK